MRRPIAILALIASLSLAACSSGGGNPTAAPASEAPAVASAPAASAPAASAPAASADAGGGGGAGCQPSTDTATVTVDILDFSFSPADVQAKVGDVIGFTNAGSAPHTATLDEGDCSTETLDGGASGALAFTSAGTFPFHCRIHSAMTGTITVTE
jgi:plastocyanin